MSDKIDLTPWENHDGPPPDFDSPAYPVFDSGVTWTIGQLAVVLSVDCNDFSWDAATEEYDGDVRAVIGNAITAALGEEWSALRAELEALRAESTRLRDEIDRLTNPPKRYCAKCGHPEDNHPYRHPFVALETKGTRDE